MSFDNLHSNTLEAFVLHSIEVESDLEKVKKIVSMLDEDLFFNVDRRHMFKIIRNLCNANRHPDIAAIRGEGFPKDKVMDCIHYDIGGINPSTLQQKVEDLKTLAMGREAYKRSETLKNKLMTGSQSDFYEILTDHCDDIKRTKSKYKGCMAFTTADTIRNAVDNLRKISMGEAGLSIPYGIPLIDAVLKHCRSEIVTIGAKSSGGKTSFAMQVCINIALGGYRVLCAVAETSKEKIMMNVISLISRIPLEVLEDNFVSIERENYQGLQCRLRSALIDLNKVKKNLIIYGMGDYKHSAQGISDLADNVKDQYGDLDFILVDYFQNLERPKGVTNISDADRVSATKLHEVCGEHKAGMIILSQVSKEAGKDAFGTGKIKGGRLFVPQDMLGGSALYNESNAMLFIQWSLEEEEKKRKDSNYKPKAMVYSVKFRDGADFKVPMQFNGKLRMFEPRAHQYDSSYQPKAI